jgi:Inverse autotransporter, beta-domain
MSVRNRKGDSMYVSTNRFWLRASKSMRSLLWLSLGVGLALSSRLAVGQEAPPLQRGQADVGDVVEDGIFSSDRYTGRSGEAFGAVFRAGVSSGPAIGRETSIFPVELMPYAFADQWMFFTDFRGFRATSDDWGGSLGTGLRYHSEKLDRIFGANVFYDYDNSSGALFRDVGFGFETLGELWDLRANAYFPNGVTERLLNTTFVDNSEQFTGNQITYSQARLVGNALTGMDMEVGTPLPGRAMQRHNVRLFGGWYYYKGDEVSGFAGWKTRIQANLFAGLEAQVEVTSDKQFDTNVIFGGTWTYGGYRQPEGTARTQFNRMTEAVRRNYNVAVGRTTIIDTGIVAVNPDTALPYFVEHVASYAAGPAFNGTVEDPFLTVLAAQANPGADIVFVHADSVFNSGVNLNEASVRTLGEGNNIRHQIRVATLGEIPVPRATTFTNRPIFQNAPDNGVVLTSSGVSTSRPTEFSGFQIGDPADVTSGSVGHGIFGDSVTNFKITQTSINHANGDGVLLQNLNGPIEMRGVSINDPVGGGTALHVVGGTIRLTFDDDSGNGRSGLQGEIINVGGRALWVENTAAGSFVNLTNSTITDTNGQGILIDNSISAAGGAVTVDTATINQGVGTGVEVIGGAATVTFRGNLTINQPGDTAIHIHDTLAGKTTFGTVATAGVVSPTVTITDRNDRGIFLFNNAGEVSFFGPATISSPGTTVPLVNPAAIEYQSSSGNVLFSNLTLLGGLGNGILIGEAGTNNTGQFLVGQPATITNFAGNGIHITDDSSSVIFNRLIINSRGLSGIEINNNTGTQTFNGVTSIDNALVSVSSAVNIHDNPTGAASFETLEITGATRPLPLGGGAGLNVENNPAVVSVQSLNVDSFDGVGVFGDNSGGLFVSDGIVDTTGDRPAVDVRNSTINLSFEAVSSQNSLTQGIVLVNNTGLGGGNLFSVRGINGAVRTGGLITGALDDGALFINTGGVSLAGMNIVGNGGNGVNAITTTVLPTNTAVTSLEVINSTITTNAFSGISTLSNPNVTLFGNTIRTNFDNEVQLIAARNDSYVYTIGDFNTLNGNLITENFGDAVLIQTQLAGVGSNLNLSFVRNTIVNSDPIASAGLRVDWNGTVLGAGTDTTGADVVLNNFTTLGLGGNILPVVGPAAVAFNLQSATEAASVSILSNTFNTSANGGIGIDVSSGGGNTSVEVGRLAGELLGNQMNFTGFDTRAIQMTLASNSVVSISDTNITMNGDGAEALYFPFIQGVSQLTIVRNNISIDDGAFTTDNERGIHILATSGVVTLFGEENNDIQMYFVRGTGIPYFEAPATITGSILVNGTPQP